LSIKRDTAMTPAATRGQRVITVFHTCPRVSRTFNLPAMNKVRNPSPENETIMSFDNREDLREECPLGNERNPSLRRAVCVQTDAFDNVKTVGFVAPGNG